MILRLLKEVVSGRYEVDGRKWGGTMCGRYTLRQPVQEIAEAFDLPDVPELPPRFYIVPTQPVPAVQMASDRGRRGLTFFQGGLIPSRADDPATGNRMINARAETVADTPAFRHSFRSKRPGGRIRRRTLIRVLGAPARFCHWAAGPGTLRIMSQDTGGVTALKVLVIGKGGREHALCWKLKQSPRVRTVYCAPGNAGTAPDAHNVPLETGDTRALIQFAKREGVGLTVVGPEEPLTNGIVDAFQREGLRVFGPRRDAAELEGSKVFAKELMRQAGIPTADYRIFRSAPDAEHYVLSREVSLVVRSKGRSTLRHTLLCRTASETLEAIDRIMDPREQLGPGVQVEIEERSQRRIFSTAAEACDYVLGRPLGMVIKADGLAAGKGVSVCDNLRQALEAIDQIMIRRIFGKAGDRLIIEERLDGQETSILALTDGRTIVPLESSQDHKRAFDHDEGPNTGGMGAYSPAPIVTPELMDQVEREILVPVVHALKRARRPFRGVLYAGLMLTNQGPKVLEFNVRLGDPECQAVLMRLKSDLFEALDAVVDERLDTVTLEWDPRPAVTVVMASEGYPGHYERDRVINNLEEAERMPGVKVFHAGTALRTDPALGRDGRIVTDGGRVLDVTALGDTLADAQARAYEAVRAIRFAGAWYRRDIGNRALRAARP